MGFGERTEAFQSADRIFNRFAKLLIMTWAETPAACGFTTTANTNAFRHRTLQILELIIKRILGWCKVRLRTHSQ